MTKKIPTVQITPLFRCHIFYDCNDLAGQWIGDSDDQYDFPEWDELNRRVSNAAHNADPDSLADVEHFPGGAACFPYIEITAPTWALCKAMGDAVIRCILDNGGIVEPKDNGINI
ncbi:hypothetical protein [Enterobacter hormaechei]